MTASNNPPPRVTVLMSVYNGERFLREAIDSILGQTFNAFEFLIIDDGSRDSSRDIISSYSDPRIRLIENGSNIGLTKSLNKGLSLAQGEYVARQDADDISHPTRLERQVLFLDEHPDVAVLGTQARYIDEWGRFFRAPGWEHSPSTICIRWLCIFESPFIHSSVMMRTTVVRDECGGYNIEYATNQDHELWMRIVYDHSCSNLGEPLIDFRTHPHSVSSHYTLERMRLVARTLQQAACKGLGQEAPQGWVDLWIRANNPDLYRDRAPFDGIQQMIDVMHRRFITFNDVSTEGDDIRHHKNRLLLRTACNTAGFDRLASIALFCRVCSEDLRMVRPVIPKYLFSLMLGTGGATGFRHLKTCLQRVCTR